MKIRIDFMLTFNASARFTLSLLTLLLLCSYLPHSQAQPFFEEAYIVTNSRDTIHGKIRHSPLAIRSVKIQFINAKTGENRKYFPLQIKGWYLKKSEEYYESKICPLKSYSAGGLGVFMRRIGPDAGPIRCYYYWNTQQDRGYMQTYLERKQKLTLVDFSDFRDQMVQYFGDFPLLKKRIQDGNFRKRELNKIISEYNSWSVPH